MAQQPPAGTHQPGTPKGEQMPQPLGEAGRYKSVRTTAAGRTGKSTVRDASGVVTSNAPVSPQSPYLPPA